jgi:hypothetical protein
LLKVQPVETKQSKPALLDSHASCAHADGIARPSGLGHPNRDDQMKTADRIGALSGAAYVLLGIVGNSLFSDPLLPESPTGQQGIDSLKRLADNPLAQAGMSLEFLSIASWLIFIGYVGWRLRGAGWLAAAAAVSGAVAVAAHWTLAAPMLAAYMQRETISPELFLLVRDLNAAGFMLHLVPFGVFVLCAAVAALRTGELGRILGWSGIVLGAAIIAVSAFTGLRAGESGFVPHYLLTLVWIVAVSVNWGFFHGRTRKKTAVAAEVK